MTTQVIAAILTMFAVLSLFMALQGMTPQRDPMEQRLAEYGLSDYVRGPKHRKEKPDDSGRLHLLNRLLSGYGLGEKLAKALIRADVPLTAAEFTFVMLLLGVVAYIVGSWRINAIAGFLLACLAVPSPLIFLKVKQSRRRAAFCAQLPDLLTLLVGSLRAGYGLAQAIELVAREVPDPAGKEFGRIVRATGLGLPLQRALENMAERIDSDDLDLVVTAINVQYEMGGNLSVVLDTISDTIRQRIRVLREVTTLTAQQRLTGIILALMPVAMAVGIMLLSPSYFEPFFKPGWPQILPAIAVVLMLVGYFIIQKILDIKV